VAIFKHNPSLYPVPTASRPLAQPVDIVKILDSIPSSETISPAPIFGVPAEIKYGFENLKPLFKKLACYFSNTSIAFVLTPTIISVLSESKSLLLKPASSIAILADATAN